MTIQEKIEVIRAVCVEVNPEILEIKFGCRLQDSKGEISTVLNALSDSTLIIESDGFVWRNRRSDLGKVIGRPIRLADIMQLFNKRIRNMFWDESGCFVSVKRKEFKYDYIIKDHKNIRWNLTKDDLTEQDQETIEFIYSLMV